MSPDPFSTSDKSLAIDPLDLRHHLLANSGAQLLDVREFPEFASGHIAGARSVPLSDLEPRMDRVDRSTPLILICQAGKRSAQAAGKLAKLGFRDLTQLKGGIEAWKRDGLSLEQEAGAPWALERQVRFAAGLLVIIGLVLSMKWPAAILLSWLVGGGLVLSALTDWCGMALLLARAPWNRQPGDSCPWK